MRTWLTLTLSILTCLALVAACDDNAADDRTAGEKVADAGRKTGEALDKAAEKTGEVAGKITDDTVALAKDAKDKGERATAAVQPSDAEAIHDVIAQVAEAAMRPGDFADVVEMLAEPDRKRIGEYADKKHPDLSNIVGGPMAAAWQKAYGTGRRFDINDETATFGGSTTITLGGDGKNATVVMTDLTIPFVREPGGWRIDAPDGLSGEGLKKSLIQRFDTIAGGQLPKDEVEGQRMVARQVLEAIVLPPK